MPAYPAVSFESGMDFGPAKKMESRSVFKWGTYWRIALLALLAFVGATPARAAILWSDLSATLAYDTGVGSDILGGALKRDDSSSDALYFKFHVDPLSDTSTEEYFAAFELYERDEERLGVGNALKAWAYSAFKAEGAGDTNRTSGYVDLHSSRPESSGHGTVFDYENPHRGLETTIVFKVQYVPGADDLITIWLNPDLGPGASEEAQPESLITHLGANASFDEIHLRHGGGGNGWIFSDMEIATSFSDFVTASSSETSGAISGLGRGELPFTFRSWQREQGLPQNFVRALAQTTDGYLWIGNDDGVTRFDGARFVSFGLPEKLRSGPVQTLLGDHSGALWIGSAGSGLTRWQDGRFSTFTTRDGLPADSITALVEENSGQLWIGTANGLARWRDDHAEAFGPAEFKGKAINALFKDKSGTIWLGVNGAGIFHYQNGGFALLKDPAVEGLLQNPHCLLVDQSGRLWIGAGDDLVLCHDQNQWRPYRIPRHQSGLYISALTEGRDGTVWAASSSEGLFQFKDGKFQVINPSSGLTDNLVESLLVDRDGVLWAGTHGGLFRQHPRNLFAFAQREGLGYGAVQGLAEISPGVIWAAKSSDGLYISEGGNFRRLGAVGESLGGPQINSLLMARDGSCWVAGARGLLHFKDPRYAVNQAELFADVRGLALAEDSEGGVWVGTRKGELWRRWQGNWILSTTHRQTHPITTILQDREGWMWVGTEGGGLTRFKGDQSIQVDKQGGLLSDLIRALYLDEQGVVWIGTAGGGLSRWRDGHLASFTTREGLPDNTISQILKDRAGRFWLGSNRGIACVDKNELDDLAAGKIPALYPQVYGHTEGMISEECTGGFCPAGLQSKSGLLWFSTLKGLVVIDPRPHTANTAPPPVVLEEVLLDGIPDPEFRVPAQTAGMEKTAPREASAETLHIVPGKHRLEFRYTGMSFNAPERVRFRYRLDGLDPDWVEAGTHRSALYSYVPPGHYTFRLVACNGDGAWDETGAALALVVKPHFWQVWWVIALAILAVLTMVGSGVRLVEKRKLQQRLRRLEQEGALERERTRIAQDLHDAMGSRLCRISFLSEHARRHEKVPLELRQEIASISNTSREVLYSLDEIVWAVNPQNDWLEHLVSYIGQYAQEYFQETGIECELHIPTQLPSVPLSSQLRHHLLLAVREAFTNILKHSGATHAQVSITCEAGQLEIATADNGRSFDISSLGNGHEGLVNNSGNGLRNMRRRLLDIGGLCLVESAPGKGTTIRFILALDKITEAGMGKLKS